MNPRVRPILYFLLAGILSGACQREYIINEGEEMPEKPSVIPAHTDEIPRVYITTPKTVDGKDEWVELSAISIHVKVNGRDSVVYEADSLKIKGRGNTTWEAYPKKPYALKLNHKANLIGTGKTSRWVLLANWMDRTHLRNQVAFEAARRTDIEWTPSGIFVQLYMNDPMDPDIGHKYQGLYWLGEKIRVEGSHFTADYLYSFDSSDKADADYTAYCHSFYGGEWHETDVPVTLKYPDKDDYPEYFWISHLRDASLFALQDVEDAIYHAPSGDWLSRIDLNSFCDWYLVNELCYNTEIRHPKSCYFYIRDNVMYAGPVWDFDYGTFYIPSGPSQLRVKSALYYFHLFPLKIFRKRLLARWAYLKPRFATLPDYIDKQAALIRDAEKENFELWGPPYPNPTATADTDFKVNMDEDLTFDEAVEKMKTALRLRISVMDELLAQLQ